MATSSFSDLYQSAENDAPISIPKGVYDVKVTGARALAKSRMIFLDLEVLNGPAAGKPTSVNLVFPKSPNDGAAFYYRKRINGFLTPEVKQAFANADQAGTEEAAYEIIADALVGLTVTAEIDLRGEDAGQYAGSNELVSTRRLDGAPTPQPAQTQTQATPAATPAPTQGFGQSLPFNGNSSQPAGAGVADPF